MKHRITFITAFLFFYINNSYCQYQLMTISRNVVFSQTRYTDGTSSPGATSHFFYYQYGNGEYQRIKKNASNLRVYFADCPEALRQLDLYNKYRRRSKGANMLQILSAIVLVPGMVVCATGFVLDENEINVPMVVIGGGAAVGGLVGYYYFDNRTDKLIDKAFEALQNAAAVYNKHLIDNKLITPEEK